MEKILTYLIECLDKVYSRYYSKSKNKVIRKVLQDYSDKQKEIGIEYFRETYGSPATKGMYDVLNDFYNTKLTELILEGDAQEISKLKYIKLILIDLNLILQDNND